MRAQIFESLFDYMRFVFICEISVHVTSMEKSKINGLYFYAIMALGYF